MRTLALVLLTGLLAGVSLDDLARERQEQLYYDDESLPATVAALIEAPIPLADYVARYRETRDEILRFNLVLILDKRLAADALVGAERDAALAFLTECLLEANPWIRTEAVYALGNAQGAVADDAIRACLDVESKTLVYHAVVALVQIHGQPPRLSPEQVATCVEVEQALAAGLGNDLADRELRAYLNRGGF